MPNQGAASASVEASEQAASQTAVLHDLARQWRTGIARVRDSLPSVRRKEPPPAGWKDIRSSVSPLDAAPPDVQASGRIATLVETTKWLALTILPVVLLSLFSLRSKKFRD